MKKERSQMEYKALKIILLSCVFAMPCRAPAFQFSYLNGELNGSFDTVLSLGFSWRTESREPAVIGIANGGTAASVNSDDGDLNFNKGSMVSAAAKATHELELKYKNLGAFVRGSYFYDEVNQNKSELLPQARSRAGSDAKIIDAYVKALFEPGGRLLQVRAGKQVLSWGESLFIPNGINVINPIDLSKFRVAGAELKEALVASPLAFASYQPTRNLGIEGFILTHFDRVEIEPRGTFFSTNDVLSEEGDKIYLGLGRRNDQHNTSPLSLATSQLWIPRNTDRLASNRGQYGLAIRYLLPEQTNTELSFYHVNYHSRTPLLSGTAGVSSPLPGRAATYFAEYPEDIRLYGASFNSLLPNGIAVSGEYSYRRNMPLQIASTEVLLATLQLPNQITGTAYPPLGIPGNGRNPILPAGTEITGYRRLPVSQVQLAMTSRTNRLGADQIVIAEVGATKIHNFPTDIKLNGPGLTFPATTEAALLTSNGIVQPGGYATSFSWGYRLLTRFELPRAVNDINLFPRIAFAHDVKGVGPTFVEGIKTLTLGVGAEYHKRWFADLSYTRFSGGKIFEAADNLGRFETAANLLTDRDFIALTISYAF